MSYRHGAHSGRVAPLDQSSRSCGKRDWGTFSTGSQRVLFEFIEKNKIVALSSLRSGVFIFCQKRRLLKPPTKTAGRVQLLMTNDYDCVRLPT